MILTCITQWLLFSSFNGDGVRGNIFLFVLKQLGCCLDEANTSTYTYRVGENAVLPCKHNLPEIVIIFIQWVRNNLLVAEVHPTTGNQVTGRRYGVDGNASLLLSNLTSEDEGLYECHVSTHGEEQDYAEEITLWLTCKIPSVSVVLKVLGKSVRLCKTSKRKDQMYIS